MMDINSFRVGVYSHGPHQQFLLRLHTLNGMVAAAQAVVDDFRSRYTMIDILVPTHVISAGVIATLAGDRMVMGWQS